MPRLRRRTRFALLAALVVLTPALAFGGFEVATGNVREVEPGVFYRSGQLTGAAIETMIQRQNIMTILNLRGARETRRPRAQFPRVTSAAAVADKRRRPAEITYPYSPSNVPPR